MTQDARIRERSPAGEAADDAHPQARRFARSHGLTLAQAQALILVVGNDRAKLSAAAERLKGTRGDGGACEPG